MCTPTVSHNKVYCVKPEKNTDSSHSDCQVFDYYVQNSKRYFKSNTTFVFESGSHLLNSALLVNKVQNLELKGSGKCAAVHCSGPYGFIILNSSNVRIENLTISNCGQSIKSIAPNSGIHAALAFDMLHNLTISGTSLYNNRGFGVYSNRVFGSWLMQNTTLRNNSAGSKYSGGNAIIYYENCSKTDTSVETHLDIVSSNFVYGHSSKVFPTASGLTLWLSCTNISAQISNTNFSHNTGLLGSIRSTGGNLAIFYRNYTNITTNKVTVENCYISNGHANTGAGMYVSFLETPELKPSTGSDTSSVMQAMQLLNISNTAFVSNQATRTGLYIITHEMLRMGGISGVIIIQNCNFSKNYLSQGKGGVALYILNEYLPGYLQHGTPQFSVSVTNCTFSENFVTNHLDYNPPWTGESGAAMIVNVHSGMVVSFTGCIFENNACSAMVAVQSTIIFEGKNIFRNNTDINGGGLVLGENSQMYLKPHTNITFTGNHAQNVGGGIYVEDENFLQLPLCFFELDLSITLNRTLLDTVAIVMTNNTADQAGSALYRGSVDHCFLYVPLAWKSFVYSLTSETLKVFETVFSIDSNDSSSVTSKPTGICFCNSSNNPNYSGRGS